MKKFLVVLFIAFYSFSTYSQCEIAPFILDNYMFDAKVLALRDIVNNPIDPDFDNPIIPEERFTPYLEKLSAIYENDINNPIIDSFFNELEIHANASYHNLVYYKRLYIEISNASGWLNDFINTGVSGVSTLDNLMTDFDFVITDVYPSTDFTYIYLETNLDFLNILALIDDFELISEIESAYQDAGPYNGYNYNGIPYVVSDNDDLAEVCDIIITDNVYTFSLHGGDCPAGCIYTVSWDIEVSDSCEISILSIADNDLENISMYPNPTSEVIYIDIINAEKFTAKVYSIHGQEVKMNTVSSSEINVQNLTPGIYFLEIATQEGYKEVRKFIKQ